MCVSQHTQLTNSPPPPITHTDTLFPYQTFFLDHMMVFELKLLPFPSHNRARLRGGATALALLCGGVGPLLPYCFVRWGNGGPLLASSLAVAAVLLAALGVVKVNKEQNTMPPPPSLYLSRRNYKINKLTIK